MHVPGFCVHKAARQKLEMRGPEELDSSFPLGNKTHFNFFIKKETHMIQNPRESKGKPCGASRLPGANTVSVLWCALPHAHCHRHTHTHTHTRRLPACDQSHTPEAACAPVPRRSGGRECLSAQLASRRALLLRFPGAAHVGLCRAAVLPVHGFLSGRTGAFLPGCSLQQRHALRHRSPCSAAVRVRLCGDSPTVELSAGQARPGHSGKSPIPSLRH